MGSGYHRGCYNTFTRLVKKIKRKISTYTFKSSSLKYCTIRPSNFTKQLINSSLKEAFLVVVVGVHKTNKILPFNRKKNKPGPTKVTNIEIDKPFCLDLIPSDYYSFHKLNLLPMLT